MSLREAPSFSQRIYKILQACIDKKDIHHGRDTHSLIVKCGMLDSFIGSHLIRMYSACSCLLEANHVFQKLPTQNVFSWNAIISAHINLGRPYHAVDLYFQMNFCGYKPDAFVAVSAVKACSQSELVTQGRLIHFHIIECGFDMDAFVQSSLLDMYGKNGWLEEAKYMFCMSAKCDCVTWNAMILTYSEFGHCEDAIKLYTDMLHLGFKVDNASFIALLRSCSGLQSLNVGKLIHVEILETGIEADMSIMNSLISMYAKCGGVEDAQTLFGEVKNPTLVTWSAMIAGHGQNEQEIDAFRIFIEMLDRGFEPNNITYVSILKACTSLLAVHDGMLIHILIICELLGPDSLLQNTLIDMYCNCGSLKDAYKVFKLMTNRRQSTWNTIIGGCSNLRQYGMAVEVFYQMLHEGNQPSIPTYISVLKACSALAALDKGKLVHFHILEHGLNLDEYLASSLIEMYANCGSICDASNVFIMSSKLESVLLWSVMIQAYVQHDDCKLALEHFWKMQLKGFKPDDVTFVSLLSACNRCGQMHEAYKLYNMMVYLYGVSPILEHFTCLAGVLGRIGLIEYARDILLGMPFMLDTVGLISLLSNCHVHGVNNDFKSRFLLG